MHKEGKDHELIKSYRPISLLNLDYMLYTKILASRLDGILPKLINDDQCGFMKGRFIGQHIRFIQDLVAYINKHSVAGFLLQLDFV